MSTRISLGLLWALLLGWVAYYAIFFGPYFLGKPMWSDEVFTAYVTGPDMLSRLDWITGDVHPPLYVALAAAFRRLPGMMDAGHSARFLNLALLIPMALGLLRLGRVCGAVPSLIAANLLAGSLFFAVYLIEFRSYFAMLSLATLLTCLVLVAPTPRSVSIGRWVAVALAFLHYFGTAFAVAVLCYRLAMARRAGERLWPDVAAIGLIIGGIVIWIAIGLSTYMSLVRNGFWIELRASTITDVLKFGLLAWASMAAAMILTLWDRANLKPVLPMLAVAAMVIFGTWGLSLIEPIITARNLIVLLPLGAVGAAVLWAQLPQRIWPVWVFVAANIAVAPSFLDRREAWENLDFIAAHAYPENCAGVPLYAEHTWAAFVHLATVYDRPQRPITDDLDRIVALVASGDWPQDCTEPAYLRHTGPLAQDIVDSFAAAGIGVTQITPPVPDGYIPQPKAAVFTIERTDPGR